MLLLIPNKKSSLLTEGSADPSKGPVQTIPSAFCIDTCSILIGDFIIEIGSKNN
jgi:hypothetical protein